MINKFPVHTGGGDSLNDLFIASNNEKFILTSKTGVIQYNDSGIIAFITTGNSGLPGNEVICMKNDSEGGLWFGTNKGLARLNNNSWNVYNTLNSGIADDYITSIDIWENNIYIGTNNGVSVFDYHKNEWRNYNSGNSSLANDTITTIHYFENTLYAGTPVGLCFLSRNWDLLNEYNSELGSGSITKLETSGEYLYVRSSTGLFYIYNAALYSLGHLIDPFYILKDDQSSFTTDQDGGMYINAEYLLNDPEFDLISPNRFFVIRIHPKEHLEIFPVKDHTLSLNLSSFIWSFDPKSKTLHFIRKQFYQYLLVLGLNEAETEFFITGKNFKYLDINKVKAAFNNKGIFNWDFDYSEIYPSPYYVPYDPTDTSGPVQTLHSMDIWLTGKTAAGVKKKSSAHYYNSDYQPGIIDQSDPTNIISMYNKVWKVNRSAVEEFKAYYLGGGDTAYFHYEIPQEILDWPGNYPDGSVLAPFVDVDNDGTYDPYKGDHPEMKGDQMLWWVFNDANRQFEPIDSSMMMEFQVTAYAYHCPEDSDSMAVIEKSTFYDIKMVNRGSEAYYDIFSGINTDVDLGYNWDDYTGCNPQYHYGYYYNSTNTDAHFGEMPPMFNFAILNGPKADANDGIDNDRDGETDEQGEHNKMNVCRVMYKTEGSCKYPRPGYPVDDFYNYNQGLLITGDSLRRNGGGCYWGTTGTTFTFDGTPYDPTTWTEYTDGNPPGDRRLLLSSGPFSLAPDEARNIEFAVIYTRDTTGPNGLNTSIKTNHEEVRKVINWFNTRNYTGCTPSYPVDSFKLPQYDELVLFPNPAKDKITIRYTAKEEGAMYTIFDMQGRVRLNGIMNRYPFQIIDISRFETGTFIIRMVDADEVFIKKFVKAP